MPLIHSVRDIAVRYRVRKDCTKMPGRTCVREEMLIETGRHQWNREPRLRTAPMSVEGGDNWQWHQRMEQETGAASGKLGNIKQDLQENHKA
jgi:hypothetical protein